MRLNNSPEDDTEGHKFKAKRLTDEDDTEGHKFKAKRLTDEDDTEGHINRNLLR